MEGTMYLHRHTTHRESCFCSKENDMIPCGFFPRFMLGADWVLYPILYTYSNLLLLPQVLKCRVVINRHIDKFSLRNTWNTKIDSDKNKTVHLSLSMAHVTFLWGIFRSPAPGHAEQDHTDLEHSIRQTQSHYHVSTKTRFMGYLSQYWELELSKKNSKSRQVGAQGGLGSQKQGRLAPPC